MRYLSIDSVLRTVEVSRHAPSLEKQAGEVPPRKICILLLWTGTAAKDVLAT